jgi:hypothetical protein
MKKKKKFILLKKPYDGMLSSNPFIKLKREFSSSSSSSDEEKERIKTLKAEKEHYEKQVSENILYISKLKDEVEKYNNILQDHKNKVFISNDLKNFLNNEATFYTNKINILESIIKENNLEKNSITLDKIKILLDALYDNLIIKYKPKFNFYKKYENDSFKKLFYFCFTDNLFLDRSEIKEMYFENAKTVISSYDLYHKTNFDINEHNIFHNDNFERAGDIILLKFSEETRKQFFLDKQLKKKLQESKYYGDTKTDGKYFDENDIINLCLFIDYNLKLGFETNQNLHMFFNDENSEVIMDNLLDENAIMKPLNGDLKKSLKMDLNIMWKADYFESFLFGLVLHNPNFKVSKFLDSCEFVKYAKDKMENFLNDLNNHLEIEIPIEKRLLQKHQCVWLNDKKAQNYIDPIPNYPDGQSKKIKLFFKNIKKELKKLL